MLASNSFESSEGIKVPKTNAGVNVMMQGRYVRTSCNKKWLK